VKEVKREGNSIFRFKFSLRNFSRPFKVFLLVSVIFSLGNSSDAFLILRAKDLGFSLISVVFVYVLFNLTYTLFSTPFGIVSDRVGPRKILLSGFMLFSIIYLLFGLAKQNFLVWVLFPFYGVYMALSDGVGKAYISNLVPQEKIGTAFGIYQTSIGVCTFFASLIAGFLWTEFGPQAPFIFGSVLAVVSGILFMFSGKFLPKFRLS